MQADLLSPLPSADWRDRFEGDFREGGLAPIDAAYRLLENPPSWIRGLMFLRNRMVALVGLRSVEMKAGASAGGFPVIEATPHRAVLGFDDRHLDFRIVVDTRQGAVGQIIGVTTLVHRKNLLGRVYLLFVGPLHKRIVPATLRPFCTNVRSA
ncbi:DUF2867 domain-containing protein [Sinorhizobium sp. BG8]|uniref:DUF2867 domain-containing protein n=1 Tax=Sinorhizobium sp. BG8 TaxID=2613773 RepID=UPI001FEE7ECA|nr:DUF2867 domain-containing protein [Sinorhizobium sp. BG8]